MEYWQTILIYWLVIHFLLEFTIFPARDEKLYSSKKLLWIQMAIYGIAMLPCMLFVIDCWWKALLAWGLLMIVRCVLVCLRYYFESKNLKPKVAYWLAGIHQTLMVGILLIVCYVFLIIWGPFYYWKWLEHWCVVVLLILMIVLVWDVASCFYQKAFQSCTNAFRSYCTGPICIFCICTERRADWQIGAVYRCFIYNVQSVWGDWFCLDRQKCCAF